MEKCRDVAKKKSHNLDMHSGVRIVSPDGKKPCSQGLAHGGTGGQGSCIEAPCHHAAPSCRTNLEAATTVNFSTTIMALAHRASPHGRWPGKLVLWRNQSLDSRGQDSGGRKRLDSRQRGPLARWHWRIEDVEMRPRWCPSCPVGLAGTLHFLSRHLGGQKAQ